MPPLIFFSLRNTGLALWKIKISLGLLINLVLFDTSRRADEVVLEGARARNQEQEFFPLETDLGIVGVVPHDFDN